MPLDAMPGGGSNAATIGLTGLLLHWIVGALLLLFFVQLPRFGAHRERLWTWTAAWAALVVGYSGEALAAFGVLFGNIGHGTTLQQLLDTIHLPARLAFLVLVTMGAINASGRRISGPRQRQVVAAAIVVGLLIAFLDAASLSRQIQMLATPLLFFGSAQLVLAAARGERERGLTALALGMVVFAVMVTGVQLANFLTLPQLGESGTRLIVVGSGFAMAFAVALLGSAVVALVVQDSVLQAAQAREDHLRDVDSSEARLKRIIEAAGEAIVTFDASRRIDLANVAAARLFELPAGTLVGRPLDTLIDIGDADWDTALAPLTGDSPRQATLTASARRRNGESFAIEFTLGALDLVEQSWGGVAILRDLSPRIAAEQERELFERRIAESEKMLAIGRVVSGVAHELNNPLAVVLGQSEELVSGAIDDRTRTGLQLINEQAHRARHIVKDLLAFVRPREDRREPVALTELVERVIAGQQAEARHHGVTVSVELERPGAMVQADRTGLEQVLINLLDNAMDAAGQGGNVRVVVHSESGRAMVTVEDDGPGVADEHIHRIFEPFFTTKPTGQGTGLGLAVSAGLMEQVGGTLVLENRPAPGVGARFVIVMPRVAASATTPEPTMTGSPSAPRVPPGRVMLIDDEPAVRATIARIFTRWGWQTVETDSARDGLAQLVAADGARFDLVLCDLKMPEMTGSEFYASLSVDAPAQTAKVIFVTGDVVEPDTAKFLASAGREVVEKPFTMAEIARAVENVLQRE